MRCYVTKERGFVPKDGGAVFMSVEEAQGFLRAHPGAEAVVLGGQWRTSLCFTEADSGSVWTGRDGAVLTGGLGVPYAQTGVPEGEIRERFAPGALAHIRTVDLRRYGAGPGDWGGMYPIGRYSTQRQYTGGQSGENIEVCSGGKRCRFARYPDEGYLKLEAVADVGECGEFPPQNYWRERAGMRDPRPGCYIVDKVTAARIAGWKDTSTAWIFGYFYWDWADASAPFTADTAHRALYPKYVAHFGARAGADYYLYNVPEELDAPGEFWLDRESGILYVYPYAEGDEITVSLASRPLLSGHADNITVRGFELTGVRADGISLTGSGIRLEALHVHHVSGHGMTVNGYRNIVTGCEVSHTGRGGIYLTGGDRETLKAGENRAEYNYIHHYSEVYQTYQNGVDLSGVGNVCAHNEICFTPHTAIGYSGNGHVIEYNDVHDAVLYSGDAGAIYAGQDWAGYGTVVRYNILRRIGGGGYRPHGIYWDDGLSGQTAYGNVLVGIEGLGFLVGGGRDCVVRDNVVIGAGMKALHFDDRNRDGFLHEGWAHEAVDTPEGMNWKRLRAVPYNTSPVWKEKYPSLAAVSDDFSNPDDPAFPINPTGTVFENNVIVGDEEHAMVFAESLFTYGCAGENPVYASCEEAGFDPEALRFTVPRRGFADFPPENPGRER